MLLDGGRFGIFKAERAWNLKIKYQSSFYLCLFLDHFCIFCKAYNWLTADKDERCIGKIADE